MNLILCGLSRSGKTTVGHRLAEKMGWSFFDTDHLAGSRTLFHLHGESWFRHAEKEAIASLAGTQKSIIATGGGSLLDPDNRKLLASLGLCIYLRADPKTLHARGISPHLATQEAIERRLPFYEEMSHITIDIERMNQDEIADEILWRVTPSGIFLK